jgi:hypothetical protein
MSKLQHNEADERLRSTLLEIAADSNLEPEQRAHLRGRAVAERLVLDLPRLIDLTRVPENQCARFRVAIIDVVLDAWDNDDLCKHREAVLQSISTSPALLRVARTLRAARQALANIDKPNRKALEGLVGHLEDEIDGFSELVFGGIDPTQPQVHHRGRRSGSVKNRPFRSFVRDLFRVAEAAGGRFTFEKNTGRGTLIEAIRILGPCLPDGFVPKALPFSTLQRVKSSFAKRR